MGGQRASRRRGPAPHLAIAGAAVLAAALLVGAGAAVGRQLVPSSAAPGVRAGTAVPGSGADEPSAVLAGPTGLGQGGAPLGYAHSRDGALMAAVHDGELMVGPLLLHPDRYRSAVRQIAAPAASDALLTLAEQTLTSMESGLHLISDAADGLPAFVVTRMIRGAVTRYDDTSADVEVLGVALIGNGQTAPLAVVDSGTFTVDWVAGDWHLASDARLPAWGSAAATFSAGSPVRPGFVDTLQDLGDAPPAA